MGRATRPTTEIGPFLKWAGGKGQLLDQFERFIPSSLEGRGYVEPFMGSAAVFFHVIQTRQPKKCTLLDANPELVNLFVQVRDNLDNLLPLLAEHRMRHSGPDVSGEQRKDYYYRVRADQPTSGTPEAAARFLYLNKTCFNGLHRLNSKGMFNVPIGNYKNPKIFDQRHLEQASRLLQGVTIATSSFRDCERFIEDDDFVYCDPPYEPLSSTSSFTAYAKDAFTREDQAALRELLVRTSHRRQWMLSNSTADFIEDLYQREGMFKHHVLASRAINSVGDGRGKIRELVVTNYDVASLAVPGHQLPLTDALV